MLGQQAGKWREASHGDPKTVHCPQSSLNFPLSFLLSGVSEFGLGLREYITEHFSFQFEYWTMTMALKHQK